MTNETDQPTNVGSSALLGLPPEPAGFRSRYRSEPGMIGHYPWSYADQTRRRTAQPTHEDEDLYTGQQVVALLDAKDTEIDRLRVALKAANDQAEHFEREWYLRGDALDKIATWPHEHDTHLIALRNIARDALQPNL